MAADYAAPPALAACPRCGEAEAVLFLQRREKLVCGACEALFDPQRAGAPVSELAEYALSPLRVFLSYGHDQYAPLAVALKHFLEARGHEVWFDLDQLSAGKDWEQGIVDGLEWITATPQGRFVLLLTPHAVRRPNGYCLNEVARAVSAGVPLWAVMVVDSLPPQSIETLTCYDLRACASDDAEEMQRRLDSVLFRRHALELASLLELGVQPTSGAEIVSAGGAASAGGSGAGSGDGGECEGEGGDGTPRLLLRYAPSDAALAARLREGLVEAGYEVFALDPQDADRPAHFSEGLRWIGESGKLLLLMTPESVGRPNGVALNEVTAASHLDFVPLMVRWCEVPLSLCRIQWLDLRSAYSAGGELLEAQVAVGLRALTRALAKGLDVEGVQSRLGAVLRPIEGFEADIARHSPHFCGREWLLDRIDAWIAGPAAAPLWVVGPIGSGKTAVAARLCERRPDLSAFHLASYVDETKRDPRRCVLSLAFQLSTQLPGFAQTLLASRVEEVVQMSALEVLFDKLLVQPLAATPEHPERVVLLIDAIDAMDSELARLVAAVELPPWCRVLVFSRAPPPDPAGRTRAAAVRLAAHADETRDDLKQYLRKHLAFYYDNDAAAVPDEIMDFIVQRADGLFLYAEQVVNAVADGRLDLGDLSSFPTGLGGVLLHTFRSQFPDIGVYEQQCRPLLEVVVAAFEPLPNDTLAQILGLSSYDMLRIATAFGALFTTVRGTLKPFHPSVYDWLRDAQLAGLFFVDTSNGHRLLADWSRQQYEAIAAREHPSQSADAHSPRAEAFLAAPSYVLRHALTHLAESGSHAWSAIVEADADFALAQRVLAIRENGLSSFYHRDINRAAAEAQLRSQPRGTFLIRFSTSQNSYCVSFVAAGGGGQQVNHYLLFEIQPEPPEFPHGGISTQAQRAAGAKVYADLVEFVVDFQLRGILTKAVSEG